MIYNVKCGNTVQRFMNFKDAEAFFRLALEEHLITEEVKRENIKQGSRGIREGKNLFGSDMKETYMFSAYSDNLVLEEYIFYDAVNNYWSYDKAGGVYGKHSDMLILYLKILNNYVKGAKEIRQNVERYADNKGYKLDKYAIDYMILYWAGTQHFNGSVNIEEYNGIIYVRVDGSLLGKLVNVCRNGEYMYIFKD